MAQIQKLQRALSQEIEDSDGLPAPQLSPHGHSGVHSSNDAPNSPVILIFTFLFLFELIYHIFRLFLEFQLGTNFKSPQIAKARMNHLETMDALDINEDSSRMATSGSGNSSETTQSTVPGVSLSLNTTTNLENIAGIERHSATRHGYTEPRNSFHASHSGLHSELNSESKLDQSDSSCEEIDFLRIWIQREKQSRDTEEVRTVCRKLQTACMLRERWVYTDKHGHFPSSLISDQDICLNINIVRNALPKKSNHCFELKHGVFRVFKLNKKRRKSSNKTSPSSSIISSISTTEEALGDVGSDVEEQIEYDYVQSEEPLYNVGSFGEFMKDLGFLMQLITLSLFLLIHYCSSSSKISKVIKNKK